MKYIATLVVEADDEAHARRLFRQYERMSGITIAVASIVGEDEGPRNSRGPKGEPKPVHSRWMVMTAMAEGATYAAEISRRTGLSDSVVALRMRELQERGWAEESQDVSRGKDKWSLTTDGYRNMGTQLNGEEEITD